LELGRKLAQYVYRKLSNAPAQIQQAMDTFDEELIQQNNQISSRTNTK
jgi:hypothetical protein